MKIHIVIGIRDSRIVKIHGGFSSSGLAKDFVREKESRNYYADLLTIPFILDGLVKPSQEKQPSLVEFGTIHEDSETGNIVFTSPGVENSTVPLGVLDLFIERLERAKKECIETCLDDYPEANNE